MDELIGLTIVRMQKVLDVLKADLMTVRVGRAAPSLVENIIVRVYGGSQALRVIELATISVRDPRTITVTPFDSSIIDEVQKGILEANIGLNPMIASGSIQISIPELSEERRQQLLRLVKQKLENGKVMIRQARHESMIDIKKKYTDKLISEDDLERLEKEVQNITDKIIEEIEQMGKKKEEELMKF